MNKTQKIKALLVKLFSPDRATLANIGEDFRKIGVTIIGVAVVGLTIAGDSITAHEASLLLMLGIVLWCYGIYITKASNAEEE